MGITKKVIVSVIAVFTFGAIPVDNLSFSASEPPRKELAKEQVLKVGVAQADINTLDSAFQSASTVDVLCGHIYGYLNASPAGRIDFDNLEGEIASNWQVTENGKVWTFQLRKGIYFHDGNAIFPTGKAPELTAEDVKYSFERLMNPETGSPHASDYRVIDKIDVVDRYTVRFRLKQSDPFFAMLRTYHFKAGAIISKIAGEKIGKKGNWGFASPIGTGPFKFAEYVPKEKVVLVANEKYFRGAPSIKRIEWIFMPDITSRTMAFVSRQVDAIDGDRDIAWMNNLKKMKPDTIIEAIPLGSGCVIQFNMTKKPLDNIKVRKALAYATDRETFKKLFGEIWLECTSIVPPYYKGALAKKDTPKELLYEYDLEKAKQLLKEAGYAGGFKLSAFSSPRPNYKNIYEVAQAAWDKIGVKLEIKMVDHATFLDTCQKDMNDIIVVSADRAPIADAYLTEWWHSKSGVRNFSHYGNVDADGDGKIDIIDRFIEEARSELDPVKRNKLWASAQLQVLEHAAAKPLHDLLRVLVRQPWVDLGADLKSTLSGSHQFNEKTTVLKH